MNGKKSGGLTIFFGVIMFLGAFVAYELAKYYRGHRAKVMVNYETLINEGVLGYNKEAVELSEFIFWVLVICGIIFVLIGVAQMIFSSKEVNESTPTSKEISSTQSQKKTQWICSNCQMINYPSVSKCVSCGASKETGIAVREDSATKTGVDEWICPNCGRINQHYVGTCGCGKSKP